MVKWTRRGISTQIAIWLALAPLPVEAQVDSSSTSVVSVQPSAEEHDLDKPLQPSYTRLAIIGGIMAGSMTAIHLYQSNGWWKTNRGPFHFAEDFRYGRNVDKVGHFYGASVLTFVMSKSFQWANIPEARSLVYGACASTLFQTYIEVQDGFSKAWGFDRVDFAANVAGAWFPVARHYAPVLQNFDVKLSYIPSKNINKPGPYPGQTHLVMDDYEGQTFWLGLKVNNLLPGTLDQYWPDFLGLSVGYGARDILSANHFSVYFIGLDLDMTRVIPQDTWFLKALGEALNYIRLPLPAVQVAPTTKWYGLYF